MLDIIFKLFQDSPSLNLEQPQREGMVDLLVLVMLWDGRADKKEKEVLESAIGDTWESETPLYAFYTSSVNRTLDIMRSKDIDLAKAYIDDIYTRLSDKELRSNALEACNKLVKADKDISPEEEALLDGINSRFNLEFSR